MFGEKSPPIDIACQQDEFVHVAFNQNFDHNDASNKSDIFRTKVKR